MAILASFSVHFVSVYLPTCRSWWLPWHCAISTRRENICMYVCTGGFRSLAVAETFPNFVSVAVRLEVVFSRGTPFRNQVRNKNDKEIPRWCCEQKRRMCSISCSPDACVVYSIFFNTTFDTIFCSPLLVPALVYGLQYLKTIRAR